jgi:hypothetical protein
MKRPGRLVIGLVGLLLAVWTGSGCVRADSLTAVLADDLALTTSVATQAFLLGLQEGNTS